MKFLKRIGDSNKFIYGAEKSYDILLSDIECKLPHPMYAGGSERQISQLILHHTMLNNRDCFYTYCIYKLLFEL